jgi:membrane protease YdiL (CAAX protease family)
MFLFHQSIVFLTALIFLSLVRYLSGRDIHLGRDPIGVVDGLSIVFLSFGIILFTEKLYYWVKGENAKPLGISFSGKRFLQLILGLIVGFAFIIAPWIIALFTGTAFIRDRIEAHFDKISIVGIVCVGFLLLLLQGIVEEIANRAFPMQLWEERSVAFRLLVPSLFFVIIHLAGEGFIWERIGTLFFGGVLQGLAYFLTGNIWFSSGLHTGANFALFSISGLWYAGAIVHIEGNPFISNLTTIIILLMTLFLIYLIQKRQDAKISNC